MNFQHFFLVMFICISNLIALAQPTNLPLMQISDLEYEGGFKFPSDDFGVSSANYSSGTIAYNPTNASFFMSGFNLDGVVAEFDMPQLVNSTDASVLNDATILQNFTPVLSRTADGNPQSINRITGMTLIGDKLFVNGLDYYDAAADNTHTTLVVDNAAQIANSTIQGYYSLDGAAHASGWISAVPSEWQALLGTSYIMGNSSRYSINSRLPMGLTAFAFNPSDISGTPAGIVPTVSLLDFSLSNPLYADYTGYEDANYNVIQSNGNLGTGHTAVSANVIAGQNDLWTEESQASYGFIVPGTRTYLSIGASGGHVSGIGYKPIQINGDGSACGGPCSYDANDNYNYYWLWDVNDLLQVKNGTLSPHDVRPYDYGVFNAPFQTDQYTQTAEFHPIVGGAFDENSGMLYLSIYDGGSTGPYDRVPAVAAYKIGNVVNNCPAQGTVCDDNNPATVNDIEDGLCGCSGSPSVNNNTCLCPDIVDNANTTITVQTVAELDNALQQADIQNGNMTILIEPGVYQLQSNLRFISANMENLTIMGSTGNRDDVIIKGLGWNNNAVTHIFNVTADGFTAAHMTIGEVFYHAIQVHSNPNDADDFTVQNVRFVDIKEQMLKVSAGGALFADRGKVLCCEFEFTAGIAYQYYTGGIDAHRSLDWTVHNNVFKGIRSPDGTLAEHAIHFWRESGRTTASGNVIINCDRGIGYGLGSDLASGHTDGGLIMNNFVHTNRDVGIGLESAPDVKVYNNTVVTDNYPRSIEYRFPTTTNAQIINNLVSGSISDRSSGSTGTTSTNYTINDYSIFVDAANYNYHLVSMVSNIVDAGTVLPEVTTDIDCDNRVMGGGMDIGADEFSDGLCLDYMVLQNTISQDVYQAQINITSDGLVASTTDVHFRAGESIGLNEGFTVELNATFLAEIGGCN